MNRNTARMLGVAVIWVTLLVVGSLAQAPQIGYAPRAGARGQDTLLLRDFKPQSMLHTTSHLPQRAKFPVIDVHNHVNDAMRSIDGEHVHPAELVRMMDQLNIKTIVILTGLWGEKLQRVVDEMVKPYPGRFMVFTMVDWSRIDDPDFSRAMVQQVDDAVLRGARGLKVLKDLGLGVRDRSGKLVAVDDPRLDPIWEECGRLDIPVFIHTGDPEAFFHPVDASNERYEELIEPPDWSFSGPQFPSLPSLLEARNRVFGRHPRTTFVSLHMGWPEKLDWVAEMLDRYPNVYVEFGARETELGRQPRRTRKLFIDYQDRVMFGTDLHPEPALYQNYFRWLETADEYFPPFDRGQGRWNIYGLDLPDPVLEKIYHLNAEKLFGRFDERKLAEEK